MMSVLVYRKGGWDGGRLVVVKVIKWMDRTDWAGRFGWDASEEGEVVRWARGYGMRGVATVGGVVYSTHIEYSIAR